MANPHASHPKLRPPGRVHSTAIQSTGIHARRAHNPSAANICPTNTPTTPISMPSATEGNATRQGEAPSAPRTEASWLRPIARSIIRLVRLTMAINNSSAAQASHISEVAR